MSSRYSNSAARRYVNGYSVAYGLGFAGDVVKVISLISILLTLLVTVVLSAEPSSPADGFQSQGGLWIIGISIVLSLVTVYFVGLFFIFLGQFLRIKLDTLVLSSHFLTVEDQAPAADS